MTPDQLARILSKANEHRLGSELDALDERELELFSILAQGYAPNQIHSEFGIDQRQLKMLKQRVRKKLRLKSDVEMLLLAAKTLRG